MAWGNGFLRLCIVLAVVWCGATVAIVGKDEFKGLWQPRVNIQVEYDAGNTDDLDGSRSREDLRRQIIAGMNKGAAARAQRGETAAANKQIDESNKTADELLNVIDDESAKRADQLYRALSILLIPPIALFVVGLVIAWVANGFRRRAT
jgi:septal ring factor EnvC (AmiA/AmiB activator)